MSDYRVISGKTDIYAVIGNPVIHSLSPILHNAVFQHEKLNKVYIALRADKSGLKLAIDALRLFDIKGLNVTMPLKEDIIKYLDALSTEAELIGAVNCIDNNNGFLTGYNTDSTGFWQSLVTTAMKHVPNKVFIFGAGGVARAIAYQLVTKGVKVIYLTNRNLNRAEELAKGLNCLKKTETKVINWQPNKWRKVIGECSLIINCTSLGMNKKGNLAQIVPWQVVRNDAIIYDTIYEPSETSFLKKAKQMGLRSVGGISLFIHQACDSQKIWTGIQPPIDVVKTAIEDYMVKNAL
jgi:shikimate dehydrogenase